MKTKHTPGPWTINEWPQSDREISIGAIGTPLIAKAFQRDVSINEQKANARLIAAAPELLQCLINAKAAIEALSDGNDTPLIKEIENTIQKATQL